MLNLIGLLLCFGAFTTAGAQDTLAVHVNVTCDGPQCNGYELVLRERLRAIEEVILVPDFEADYLIEVVAGSGPEGILTSVVIGEYQTRNLLRLVWNSSPPPPWIESGMNEEEAWAICGPPHIPLPAPPDLRTQVEHFVKLGGPSSDESARLGRETAEIFLLRVVEPYRERSAARTR